MEDKKERTVEDILISFATMKGITQYGMANAEAQAKFLTKEGHSKKAIASALTKLVPIPLNGHLDIAVILKQLKKPPIDMIDISSKEKEIALYIQNSDKPLKQTDIARALAMSKSHLSVRWKRLIEAKIILVSEQGLATFNSQHEAWVNPKKVIKQVKEKKTVPKIKDIDKDLAKPKSEKHSYGQFKNVKLTDDEYGKVMASSDGQALIDYLDEHIERKGYKAKSHYLCMVGKGWVLDALKERRAKDERLANNNQAKISTPNTPKYGVGAIIEEAKKTMAELEEIRNKENSTVIEVVPEESNG